MISASVEETNRVRHERRRRLRVCGRDPSAEAALQREILKDLNFVFAAIFTLEMLVKITALGWLHFDLQQLHRGWQMWLSVIVARLAWHRAEQAVAALSGGGG